MADFFVWIFIFSLQAVLSALCTSLVALRHGHSPRPYLGLAVVLGFGAIPLTYLIIRNAEPLGPRPEVNGFSPLRSQEKERIGSTVGVDQAEVNAALDLASWKTFSATLDHVLIPTLICSVFGAIALLAGVFLAILPNYLYLLDNMSLKIPMPTLLMISITKYLSRPQTGPVLWIASISLPSCFYLALERGGYWLPVLGPIWRHNDRLWQLHLRQTGSQCWEHEIPSHVARRLHFADVFPGPKSQEQLSSSIGRERQLLNASLWMCVPVFFAILALLGVALFVLIWTLSLPFYQIRGNL